MRNGEQTAGAGARGVRGETRRKLVDAAAGLFWAEGYAATSIAEVATAAGVPAGNVFYHFKAKADLARAVVDLFTAETEASLTRIGRRTGEPRARMGAFFGLLAEAVQSRVARGCPIARGTTEFPPEAEPARPFAAMAVWLEASLAAAGVDRDRARAASLAALARWQGAIVLAHAFGDEALLRREIQEIAAALDGLAVSAGAGPAGFRAS